jgi:hypothetical protein
MDKMSVQQAAEKWNVSIRRVQDYCRQGKIPGTERFGLNWSIPADAVRPADGRSKSAKAEAQADMPMPRKSPFLDMTNLYSEPGTADDCVLSLASHPEAQGHIFYFTTKAPRSYTEVSPYPDNVFIMFGKETRGLPEDMLYENRDFCVRIPMRDTLRSLNLSNSVAIAVYEILRQWDFDGLREDGQLTSREW